MRNDINQDLRPNMYIAFISLANIENEEKASKVATRYHSLIAVLRELEKTHGIDVEIFRHVYGCCVLSRRLDCIVEIIELIPRDVGKTIKVGFHVGDIYDLSIRNNNLVNLPKIYIGDAIVYAARIANADKCRPSSEGERIKLPNAFVTCSEAFYSDAENVAHLLIRNCAGLKEVTCKQDVIKFFVVPLVFKGDAYKKDLVMTAHQTYTCVNFDIIDSSRSDLAEKIRLQTNLIISVKESLNNIAGNRHLLQAGDGGVMIFLTERAAFQFAQNLLRNAEEYNIKLRIGIDQSIMTVLAGDTEGLPLGTAIFSSEKVSKNARNNEIAFSKKYCKSLLVTYDFRREYGLYDCMEGNCQSDANNDVCVISGVERVTSFQDLIRMQSRHTSNSIFVISNEFIINRVREERAIEMAEDVVESINSSFHINRYTRDFYYIKIDVGNEYQPHVDDTLDTLVGLFDKALDSYQRKTRIKQEDVDKIKSNIKYFNINLARLIEITSFLGEPANNSDLFLKIINPHIVIWMNDASRLPVAAMNISWKPFFNINPTHNGWVFLNDDIADRLYKLSQTVVEAVNSNN
ncbi:MAG: hypothetical protein HQL80_01870 [Magnetococcales bacterium]|nr:hypothetical protein [Magnetococcales bacterium]